MEEIYNNRWFEREEYIEGIVIASVTVAMTYMYIKLLQSTCQHIAVISSPLFPFIFILPILWAFSDGHFSFHFPSCLLPALLKFPSFH